MKTKAKDSGNQHELDLCVVIRDELDRLDKRLQELMCELEESEHRVFQSQRRAKCKRAALDVKSVLTQLTQGSVYHV